MGEPIFAETCLIIAAIISLCFSFCKKRLFVAKILSFGAAGLLAFLSIFFIVKFSNLSGMEGVFFTSTKLILFSKILILISSIILLFVVGGSIHYKDFLFAKAEFLFLFLFMIAGSLLMISSCDFVSLYMSMEIQTICLYIMLALSKKSESNIQAAIKYFVLSSVASGIFLYGVSFIYGIMGSMNFSFIYESFSVQPGLVGYNKVFSYIGMVLILSGFLFKISLVPFHMWTPDIYQKSPTVIVMVLATLSKIVGVTVIINLLLGPFLFLSDDWKVFFLILGLLSIALGSLAALSQTNIMRLLGFSSIASMGFISLSIATGGLMGMERAYIYLIIYIVMVLGIFILITEGRYRLKSTGIPLEELADLSGFSKADPVWSFMLSVFLFSLAGIPPLSGFFSKLYVIIGLVSREFLVYAIVAILFSLLGAFYYLRPIKTIYFDTPNFHIPTNFSLDRWAFLFFRLPCLFCLIVTLFYVVWPNKLVKMVAFIFE